MDKKTGRHTAELGFDFYKESMEKVFASKSSLYL